MFFVQAERYKNIDMHEHLMIIDINIDIPSAVMYTYWLNTTNKTLY